MATVIPGTQQYVLKIDNRIVKPNLTLDKDDMPLKVRQGGDRVAYVVVRRGAERPFLLFLLDAKTGECLNAVSSKEPIRDVRFDKNNEPILEVQKEPDSGAWLSACGAGSGKRLKS